MNGPHDEKRHNDARTTRGESGRIRGDRTGRDLGYPGGRHRPPRFDEAWRAGRPPADVADQGRADTAERAQAGAGAENRDR